MKANTAKTALTVLLLATMPAMATEDVGAGCCPHSCMSVDRAEVTEIAPDGRPLEVLTRSFGRIEISQDITFGVSPDGDLHICLTFGSFGDPRVKCVQIPEPLM
jgi:hypothetical protein